MKQLLAFFLVIVIAFIAIGYYRDWFTFAANSDDQKVNLHVTVDKEKVKEDEERAKEKLHDLGGKIKEEAGKLSERAKEGMKGKKASEPTP
jgi:hypothetical protein